jgi:hypothetical protein
VLSTDDGTQRTDQFSHLRILADMRKFRTAAVLVITGLLLTTITAPATTAAQAATGEGRIVTAPGLVANFTKNEATIGTQRPATTRFNRKNRAATNTRATLTFPVAQVNDAGQIQFDGAMVVRTKDQTLTLRNITVDLEAKAVYVSVKEFFGLTIEAFRIANTPTTRTNGRTTIVTNAQLVVSPAAGDRLSAALGDPSFGAGASLGRATLRYTTQ